MALCLEGKTSVDTNELSPKEATQPFDCLFFYKTSLEDSSKQTPWYLSFCEQRTREDSVYACFFSCFVGSATGTPCIMIPPKVTSLAQLPFADILCQLLVNPRFGGFVLELLSADKNGGTSCEQLASG